MARTEELVTRPTERLQAQPGELVVILSVVSHQELGSHRSLSSQSGESPPHKLTAKQVTSLRAAAGGPENISRREEVQERRQEVNIGQQVNKLHPSTADPSQNCNDFLRRNSQDIQTLFSNFTDESLLQNLIFNEILFSLKI